MSVEFGYALPEGPERGEPRSYVTYLDEILPLLEGHIRSLWMTDHFFWDDEPTYECWTVLSYLGSRYPAFDLGPAVLGQSYRNPAMTAKMAATLQNLTTQQLIFAIGAGWKEDEYEAYGYPFPSAGRRIEQLEEAVIICKKMWTEPGRVNYHGAHYQIDEAYCEPKPEPVPTVMIGGGGRKTMMVAAKHADWWNIPDTPFEKYRQRVEILHEHCRTIGRDPASIRLTWFGRLAVAASEEAAEALSGGRWTKANAFAGTPEQVIAQMKRFTDFGVDYFMLQFLGLTDKETRRMVLEEVLPAVRAAG